MIIVDLPIICPWCETPITEYFELEDDGARTSICYCGGNTTLSNFSFTVRNFKQEDGSWAVDNFGIFLNMDVEKFLACDYNVNENPKCQISACENKVTRGDKLLCYDFPIKGTYLNEVTQYAAISLKRYRKLLIFS